MAQKQKKDLIILSENNLLDYLKPIFPEKSFGKIREVEGGLSHFTFRAQVGDEIIYVKQARDSLKGFPTVSQDPKRIKNEYDALIKIKEIVGPNTVPDIIYFDEENNVLILSDASRGGRFLSDEFDNGNPHPETSRYLGSFFAKLHSESYGKGNSQKNREINVGHRCLEVLSETEQSIKSRVESLVQESNNSTEAYITADLCPKNIFTRPKKDGGVGVIDFEIAHYGDPAFDVGFLLAHYVLRAENTTDAKIREEFYDAAKILLNTYLSELQGPITRDKGEIEKRILKFTGTTMIYRVDGLSKAHYLKKENIDKIRSKAAYLIESDSVKDIGKLKSI